jgi:hypothetical protein
MRTACNSGSLEKKPTRTVVGKSSIPAKNADLIATKEILAIRTAGIRPK